MLKLILRLTFIFSFVMFMAIGEDVIAQDQLDTTEEVAVQGGDTKREEIQRYFGYEMLLYRYLTLPYDASININQQGNFVDIGLIFIVFFPLILLIRVYRNKFGFFLSTLYLFLTWVISTSNSFVFSTSSQQKIDSNAEAISSYLSTMSFTSEPISYLTACIYRVSIAIYQPFYLLGKNISGNSDYVTYPILFSIFIVMSLYMVSYLSQSNNKNKFFYTLVWIYAFFWLSFSGGIVWYGNILIILSLFILSLFVQNILAEKYVSGPILYKAFVAFCLIWLFFGMTVRISDIKPFQKNEDLGKGLYNPVFYEYATGKLDKSGSLSLIYNDIDRALDRINEEKKSRVWRIGTSFSYFVLNNNKRIIQDNQLGQFNNLRNKYPNNSDMIGFFKANNIKYIIVDLHTANIDHTPNKSLTNKFRQLLLFVINNPNLKMLATDRVVGNKDINGKMVYTRDIYGEIIQTFGRFAIYEII